MGGSDSRGKIGDIHWSEVDRLHCGANWLIVRLVCRPLLPALRGRGGSGCHWHFRQMAMFLRC